MSYKLDPRQQDPPERAITQIIKSEKYMTAMQHVADVAKFYAATEQGLRREEVCPATGWGTSQKSKYAPRVDGISQALDFMATAHFPEDIRSSARRMANKLAEVFQNVTKLERLKDQVSGRLDRRKLSEIAMTSAAGTYDGDRIAPYVRKQMLHTQAPRVVVVAASDWNSMWQDEQYIPAVYTALLGVAWAAQAADLPTYGVMLMRELETKTPEYSARIVTSPERPTPLTSLMIGLSRDLWRWAVMVSAQADAAYLQHVRQSRRYGYNYGTFTCAHDAGKGVQWAREVLQGDVVITLGSRFDDLKEADVALNYKDDIESQTQQIIKALKGRALVRP